MGKNARRQSSGSMPTKQPRRTSTNTKRKNWKRSAHQSSPKCTKELVVVCQAVCQGECQVVHQAVTTALHRVDQLLKKLINRKDKRFCAIFVQGKRNNVTSAY